MFLNVPALSLVVFCFRMAPRRAPGLFSKDAGSSPLALLEQCAAGCCLGGKQQPTDTAPATMAEKGDPRSSDPARPRLWGPRDGPVGALISQDNSVLLVTAETGLRRQHATGALVGERGIARRRAMKVDSPRVGSR